MIWQLQHRDIVLNQKVTREANRQSGEGEAVPAVA